jgi:hypothetical protein
MQVVASERARETIERRGGRVYVWVRKGRRCCGGLRTLTTAPEPHPDVEFRRVDEERGFELFVPQHLSPLPDELHFDVRGRGRSVDAYWNGCAWIA